MKLSVRLVFLLMVPYLSCVHGFKPGVFTCDKVRSDFKADDTLQTGDLLMTVYNLTGISDTSGNSVAVCNEMLSNNGSNVILKRNLSAYCKPLVCKFLCGDEEVDIGIEINRTRVYNLQFKYDVYNTTVLEEIQDTKVALSFDPKIEAYGTECLFDSDADLTKKFTLYDNKDLIFYWQAETNANSFHLNQTVDYETETSYDIMLKFQYDQLIGNATTRLHIDVTDIDDNKPAFTLPDDVEDYQMFVEENCKTCITTVSPIHAFDPDKGIDESIIYSIYPQQEANLFTIDADNGRLSVSRELDRESDHPSYRVIIQANQQDKPDRYSSTAVVMVTVTDVDDNLPKFDQIKYSVDVTEQSAAGTYVCKVTAVDLDMGMNANFSYKIYNDHVPVSIDTNDGVITVTDSIAFDRELYEKEQLSITVGTQTHNGSEGANNATVTITLIDINDNSPVFEKNDFIFDVSSIVSGSAGYVNASDDDVGPNANVTYTLILSSATQSECGPSASTGNMPYTVNTLTGEVTIVGEIFCNTYKVLVQGCDNPLEPSNRRCSTATLTLTSTTAQEQRNVTQFMKVMENSPMGMIINLVKCSGQGNQYTSFSVSPTFILNTTVGALLTNSSLDREEKSNYSMTVDVKNKLSEMLCKVEIHMTVLDMNDNAPNFTTTICSIPDGANIGDSLCTLQATDNDEGNNARITYQFHDKRETRFLLNSTTGELQLNTAISGDLDVLPILVVARDNGTPSMETLTPIYIHGNSQHNNTVPVSSPWTKHDVEKQKTRLEGKLSGAIGVEVEIKAITEVVTNSTTRSQIHIAAKTSTKSELLSRVVANYEAVRALFYSDSPEKSDGDTDNKLAAPEIALIAMAVVVLIGAVLAIFVIHRQFNSHKRYKHLYDSLTGLTRTSSLYESQEIKVKMDDETSDYHGSVRTQDLEQNDDNKSVAATSVNPTYHESISTHATIIETSPVDTNNEQPVDPTGNTSVKEVMESLEQLTDRLEEETETPEDDQDVQEQTEPPDAVNPPVYANVSLEDVDDDNVTVYQNTHFGDEVEEGVEPYGVNKLNISPLLKRRQSNEVENADEDSGEPNPDYDIKQVRFNTEVLDADKNKLEPLKNKEEITTDGEVKDKAISDDSVVGVGNTESEIEQEKVLDESNNEQINDIDDNTGWLEEQIIPPDHLVTDDNGTNSEDFFFNEQAMTYL